MKVWKYVVAVWLTVTIIGGFLIYIPNIPILEQSARNLFFHVPMWIAMSVEFAIGLVLSIKYLNKPDPITDLRAVSANQVGVVFGICGLFTGSLWARFTWGTWWTFAEPKMNLAALAMMIYLAYFVLRSAFDDPEKRARLSAVYNIFAACTIPFLLYIIPRQLPSLHPGANGNPAFSSVTAPAMRFVLYPAMIGFIALAIWIMDVVFRYRKIQYELDHYND